MKLKRPFIKVIVQTEHSIGSSTLKDRCDFDACLYAFENAAKAAGFVIDSKVFIKEDK